MPKISILIPTHNNPDTLPYVVEAVAAQSFEDFEVIIVNDGGQSPTEFLDLPDSRFEIVDLEDNRGVSHARNTAYSRARGEILYFLDADDLIAEDLLSVAYEAMQTHDCGMFAVGHVSVPVDQIDENREMLQARARSTDLKVMSPVEFCEDFRQGRPMYLPSTVFFRREAIAATVEGDPFDVSLKNAQDTHLIMLVGSRHKVVQSPDDFVMYTVRSLSLSRQNHVATWMGRISAMDKFIERLQGEDADRRIIGAGKRMRQNAARRVARAHFGKGDPEQGRSILMEDLKTHPSARSAVELVRLHVTPKKEAAG